MRPVDWILLIVSLVSPILTGAVTWGMMRVEIRLLMETRTDHETRLRAIEQDHWDRRRHENLDPQPTL